MLPFIMSWLAWLGLAGTDHGSGCHHRHQPEGNATRRSPDCAQPRTFLRLPAVTLTTGRPLSAAASSVMASALIGSIRNWTDRGVRNDDCVLGRADAVGGDPRILAEEQWTEAWVHHPSLAFGELRCR